MNKKFSTLVAAFLAAASFGATAQTVVTGSDATLTSGADYFLGDDASATHLLMVDGDSLIMKVKSGGVADMSKAKREYAVWTVSFTTTVAGDVVYEFTNKATGKKLQLPASGKAVAYATNGINQFGWLANGTYSTPTALSNKANSKELVLQDVFVLQSELIASTTTLSPSNGFSHIEVVNSAALTATNSELFKAIEDLKNITFDGTTSQANRRAANTAILTIEAELAKVGIAKTKLTSWDNLKTINLDLGNSSPVDLSTTSGANQKAAFEAEIDKYVTKYGIATIDADGKIGGIVAVTNIGSAIPDATYKKGTKFVQTNAELKFAPALMDAVVFNGTDVVTTAHTTADKDQVLVNDKFAKEFKKGTEADKDVVAELGFSGPECKNNPLAGKKLQVVKRNLLMNASHQGVDDNGTLATTDFQSVTMVYDKEAKAYLYVKPTTFESTNPNSTYFELGWAKETELKDLTSFFTGTADVKYFNGKAGRVSASYAFDVAYDANKDSVTIKPQYIIKKNDYTQAADTSGVTYSIDANGKTGATDYVLSLKQFSGAVEMTVVNAGVEKIYRINTGGSAASSGWEVTTADSDIYYIQYISEKAAEKENTGKFFTAEGLVKGSYEAFNHLPSTQWALVKDANDLVKIVNRADEKKVFTDKSGKAFNNVQLYKAGGDYVSVYNGDTLKLTSVAPTFKMDSTIGYFAYDAKKNDVLKYQLTYFNELDATKNVGVRKDSTLFVDKSGEGIWFQMKVAKAAAEYGADAIKNVSKKLKKATYTIDAIVNGKAYKVVMKNGKYAISDKSSGETAVEFDVKELMHNDLCWYVLNNLTSADSKVSVDDNTLNLFNELTTEARTSMFALTQGAAPLYRRFGETIADEIAKNDTAYVEFFKANEPNRFLYENSSNIVAENGTEFAKDSLDFLGMYNKADMKRNASIFVDTAYVRNDTIKPLYMLALGVQFTEGKADVPCPDHGMDCEHATHGAPSYTEGRYLVALNDSVANNPSATYQTKTRLAFVPAKHIADTLVIANSEFTGTKDNAGKDSLIVDGTNMHAATFAFRLVNDDPADFYMETVDGQYVRIHNGVPVLVSELEQATVFNVNPTEETPTANEGINASEVSVIASEGAVIINGAAGKKVTISNVLGQTIANTVLSSDNATISAPAGIVVVAVEGEAAVKAIVK